MIISDGLQTISYLADGHGPDAVLLPELLGEGSGHALPPDVGGRLEVPLALLPAARGHVLVQLHGE